MTSQGLGRALRQAALGLVTITAAVLLLAPTAAASPESDADDAITAAWEKAGGDNSVLGAKVGDVYPVGDGFGQDFAGGKIFFTPGTGARELYGAVLDKYESLGGPAGSDLGFPTINEVPGLSGPDSLVSTFSAGDNPVIFWTPDHGAFVVRGAMNAAWDKLGSSKGVLGVPVGDETYSGETVSQPFSGGQVSWNRMTKAFSTVPPELAQQLTGLQVPIDPTAAINMAWRAAGGPSGPLGAKQGGQYPIGKDGLAQNFAAGKVFYSFATGANAVESDILAKYESLGGPGGSNLGFPIANEADGGIKPKSRISTFSAADRPVIFWTPDHGAFVVRGAMKAAWDKLGGPTGKLGAPVEDQTVYGDVVSQKFTGGKIAWNRAKNTYSTEPADLASSLSGVRVPGQHLPAGPASAQPATGTRQGSHWWWWWLAVIPALLLLAIVALIARGRRRRPIAGLRDTMADHPYRDLEPDYDAGPDAGWSNGPEGEFGPPGFVGGYREPREPSPMG
ncbi:MAG: LGFP repeat-containing protein, partial [Mycobacterium sp.]|nr:LGFP repeat-containing protein [Mycobacterium sp.]